jgi:hypothetical protein
MTIKPNREMIIGGVFAVALTASVGAVQASPVVPGDLGGFATNGTGAYGTNGQALDITSGLSGSQAAPEDNFYVSNDTFSTLSPFSISFDYGVSGNGISSNTQSAPSALNGTLLNFFLGDVTGSQSTSPSLEFTINPYANDISNTYTPNNIPSSNPSGGTGGGTGGTGGSSGGSSSTPGYYTFTNTFVYTGSIVGVTLNYDPTTATLQEVINTSTGEHQVFSFSINLAATLGTTTNFSFEGKTGSTPATAFQQSISNFSYSDTVVPEPDVMTLLLGAGAGLLLLPRLGRMLKA